MSRSVWLISSPSIARVCDLLPANEGRQSLVTGLIEAYNLHLKCRLIDVESISEDDIHAYHPPEFTNCLLRNRDKLDRLSEHYTEIKELIYDLNCKSDCDDSDRILYFEPIGDEVEEDSHEDISQLEACDLLFDCYKFPFMSTYVKLVVATSLNAAKTLVLTNFDSSEHNIAVNWYGGRHHCKKLKAAGYCYINDIVLAIGLLRKSFKKVFYLDLDLHHGDGVESAYKLSKNVFTCSIHRFDAGFFPGSGSLSSSGPGRFNIPTRRGLSDASMLFIINDIVIPLISSFEPEVLVIQGGCDGLGTDKHKEWNLTIRGFAEVFEVLMKRFQIPTLILGGGGYNHTETAKCWTYITKTLVNDSGDWDIIPNHEYSKEYENDSFQFWTRDNLERKNLPDENDSAYLNFLKEYLLAI